MSFLAMNDGLSSRGEAPRSNELESIPRQWSIGRQALLLFVTFLVGWLTVGSFLLLPFMAKRFFGGGGCKSGDQSDPCKEAESKAASAIALSKAGQSLLCFLSSAAVGSLSDARGRLPLIIASFGLQGLMVGSMAAYQFNIMSLNVHFVLRAISGLIQPLPLLYAMAADDVSPTKRGSIFGRMAACFSSAILFAVPVTAAASDSVGALLLVVSPCLAVILILAYGESLPVQRRLTVEGGSNMCRAALTAILILNRNNFFRCLALVVFGSATISSGAEVTFILFLSSGLGLDKKGAAIYLSVTGASGVFVMIVLLPGLLRKLGATKAVLIGLSAAIADGVLWGATNLPGVNGPYVVMAGCIIEGFSVMVIPCVSTLKANAVSEAEQGSVQGAIASVQQMGSTFGSFVYGPAFHAFNTFGMPGFTYIISACISSICLMVVGFGLKQPHALPNQQTK